MTKFKDQVVVITGASSGIGKAIAIELAKQGAKLCLLGRKLETLEETQHSIEESLKENTPFPTPNSPLPTPNSPLPTPNSPLPTPQILCYQIDIAQDEDVQKLKVNLEKDFGQVDILIHSAGVIALGELKTAPVEDFDWQYRTNVRAPYLVTQTLLPMLLSRQGQIVFINSSAGLTAKGGVGQYAATKHALKAIADSLRAEVNNYGVRVLSIYPGRTASPMQAAICQTEGKQYKAERLLQPEDVASVVINALSLPPTAEVTDINVRPMMK
ncbi:MAG: SDR family NAD(P)-dependent oxidoreductase [Scytonematopsis contorta HA4267-MV1]|jgi:NADP-dependent 3-hydroxy acid dehydrogenase YdfG|nr:SDR family NAD(P)-dependent oxidoreductase [Scytonematopsis contorta HA4267-MV1]